MNPHTKKICDAILGNALNVNFDSHNSRVAFRKDVYARLGPMIESADLMERAIEREARHLGSDCPLARRHYLAALDTAMKEADNAA